MKTIYLISCFTAILLFQNTTLTQKKKKVETSFQQQYTIYLTFDDGPLDGSKTINDIVFQEQIKVNVFVVGIHSKNNFRHLLYLQNPFIEIGNHSYSHAGGHYKRFYKNPDSVLKDFLKCQQELSIPKMLARLPGRNQWRLKDTSINDIQSGSTSADLLFKAGFTVFGWDLTWFSHNSDIYANEEVIAIAEKIETLLKKEKTVKKNHLILLAHDQMFCNEWMKDKLIQLIRLLKAKENFKFEYLSNYPQ